MAICSGTLANVAKAALGNRRSPRIAGKRVSQYKLDFNNYLVWRYQIGVILEAFTKLSSIQFFLFKYNSIYVVSSSLKKKTNKKFLYQLF